ncbi:MAG TPA: ABC transporter substrate-binding protein [Candidatus Saccharimonadales bacterium]|nr:ABC transporter substrate-binding protein [Candidatus Saccharimonadales bacterium]
MKNGLLGLLVFLSLQVSVHAADKIRIGFPEFNSSTFTLPLAQIKGFFNEEGLQAELIRIRSAVALPALTSGEIDYHTVVSPAVNAALRGIPVRVVACFTPGLTTAIIARPEFKTIQDLKGKTIGLNSIGGGLESTVRMMLKHYGLDPDKDVKFLATGGVETRFAALKQGLTVATAGSTPVDYLGKKFGYVVLARAYELFSYPNTGLVAGVKKIKENPDQLKRVIKAGIKANRYLLQNREGTIQVMMQWMRIDKDTATATYDGSVKSFNDDGSVSEAGLRIAIDEARKAANITREVAINEVADFSILREAQRELGTK